MFLYSNILFLIENEISGYKLAMESGIAQSKLVELKTKNRELKGKQIDVLFKTLKRLNLIDNLDDLFYKDLSTIYNKEKKNEF